MSGSYKEVNIKSDMPTADDAIKRITCNIHNGKRMGYAAIKIIHGYGSSGVGGRIRVEARRYLESQKRKGVINDYVPGEDFSIFNEGTRRAFDACEELRHDHDLECHNNGMTLIIL